MSQEIVLSYVVTVYNKELYIGATVDSLRNQHGNIPSEFIFVDDVSTDKSLAIVREHMEGVTNVIIITNSDNKGPSVRLNQGARIARGKYIQFMDSDDVMTANASMVMLNHLTQHQADVIYGKWKKTGEENTTLLGRTIDENAATEISDDAMELVLNRRVLRMTQMVKREVFIASGGCDERIFIQDESLPLRMARVAKRWILLDASVVLVPKVEGGLSQNLSQRNHDRFLANYHMLNDFPRLTERHRRLLYRRCVSATWKQHRLLKGHVKSLFSSLFPVYVCSKHWLLPVNNATLARHHDFFASLSHVRRT